MTFKQAIAKLLSEETGLDAKEIESLLETPPDRKMGDYAFPCFQLSKQMKKAPPKIAIELAEHLKLPDGIETVEAKGPYLNFFVSSGELGDQTISCILKEGKSYGRAADAKKTYMVEFFHANTHKGVHIGHIRNICLGESLCRILESAGIKVIRANYQGDIGPHVAKAIWGYLNLHKGEEPKENRGVWLGKVYAEANKRIKDDEKLEEDVRKLTKDIYESDQYREIWKKTRQWCLDDFEVMYKQFDVKFDRLYFESEVESKGREIVKRLLKEGIAEESEGAIIVDFKDEGMGVFLLLRSDGMPLYSTKDLELAELKAREYPKIDMSLHVVGKEQELYFKQLFRTFDLYKGPLAGKSHHMIYELVMLPEGKMSSREGNVVLYEDLREKLLAYAEEEVSKRHKDWKDADVGKTAESIAFAALKFSMLNRDNSRTLVFDWKKAMDFEGETGPYLQYTVTRISSILAKLKGPLPKKADFSLLESEEEKALLSQLASFPETVQDAAKRYKPLLVAKFLVNISQLFNEFYHKHQVLKAQKDLMEARLLLLAAIKQVMQNGLHLLSIDVLERM